MAPRLPRLEPMAGGYGTRPDADGIDSGGLFCIPMGRVPDVEMTEFLYPVLTLWRREVLDSGGPGRHRGGLGASIALTPHGTSVPMGLVLASAGKAVAQNGGLAGGHPGNSGLDLVARQSRVRALLEAGRMPSTLDELADTLEPGQNYASSYLAPGEVFAMTWQGGGGYGDPLTRGPAAVARDLREHKITVAAAAEVYGVVLREGVVDAAATSAERTKRREDRRTRSALPMVPLGKVDLTGARRLDDNLLEPTGGGLACGHCGERLRTTDGEPAVAVYEGPATDAGPQIIATAADYVDAPVVFRQYCCPCCWTAVYSGVVPADHPHTLRALGRHTAPAG